MPREKSQERKHGGQSKPSSSSRRRDLPPVNTQAGRVRDEDRSTRSLSPQSAPADKNYRYRTPQDRGSPMDQSPAPEAIYSYNIPIRGKEQPHERQKSGRGSQGPRAGSQRPSSSRGQEMQLDEPAGRSQGSSKEGTSSPLSSSSSAGEAAAQKFLFLAHLYQSIGMSLEAPKKKDGFRIDSTYGDEFSEPFLSPREKEVLSASVSMIQEVIARVGNEAGSHVEEDASNDADELRKSILETLRQ